MLWPLWKAFHDVTDWCERTNHWVSFPTGETTAMSNPNVFRYRIIEFSRVVLEQRFVPMADVGLDSNYNMKWREAFQAVNMYAHSKGFFHGFPDFHTEHFLQSGQTRGVFVNLIRQAGGVTFRDVPLLELFPSPAWPADTQSLLALEGRDWILSINTWARSHGFMAGLPTGWAAVYNGIWVAGVVLLQSQAGT